MLLLCCTWKDCVRSRMKPERGTDTRPPIVARVLPAAKTKLCVLMFGGCGLVSIDQAGRQYLSPQTKATRRLTLRAAGRRRGARR